jgi:hypothetical protein
MIECWNIGRTRKNFQCCLQSINGLFVLSSFWQQRSAGPIERNPQTNASVPALTETEARWLRQGSLVQQEALDQQQALEVIIHADLNAVQIDRSAGDAGGAIFDAADISILR